MKLTSKKFNILKSSVESMVDGLVESMIEDTMDNYFRDEVMDSLSDEFTDDEIYELREKWNDIDEEGGVNMDVYNNFVKEIVDGLLKRLLTEYE